MSTTNTNENLDKVLDQMFDKEQSEAIKDKINNIKEEDLEKDDIINESKDIEFLNPVFLDFFREEPFLGAISMNITKITDYKQPTAYIGVRPNGNNHEIIMGFNPNFMRPLTREKQRGVIKHEIYHMVFQHIFSRMMGDQKFQLLWNWATDLAINSLIGKNNLPELCLIPGHNPIDAKTGMPTQGPYADYIASAPALKASDYYFDKLKEIYEDNDDGEMSLAIGSGIGTMDGHDMWDQLDEDIQEQIKEKVREIMGQAAAEAQRTNNWGTVPQEIQSVISKLLSREIDWRSILRNFIGRTRTVNRNSTIRKINKKLPYIQPGVKRPYVANFACFIDQSGSMSDDDISLLFSELESFSRETSLDVYHFDTRIDQKSHTVWKKGSPTPKPYRTRCGGTDFNAVANFCNNKENRGRWSGIVILTDGYAPTMNQIIGSKVMWVITETGTMGAVRQGDLACQMKREKQFKRY